MAKARLHTFVFTLLAAWKSSGHPVGVDTYLKVLELLAKLPADTPPARLKTWLAPILTRDKAEQKVFYEQFGEVLKNMPVETRPQTWWEKKRWSVLLAGLLVVVLFAVKIYLDGIKKEAAAPEVRVEKIRLGEAVRDGCLDSAAALEYQLPKISRTGHAALTSLGGPCLQLTPLSVGVDSVLLTYSPRMTMHLRKKVWWVIEVLPEAAAPRSDQNTSADMLPKPYAHSASLGSLVPQAGPLFSWRKSDVAPSALHKWVWLLALAVLLLQIGLFRNLLLYKKPETTPEQSEKTGVDRAEGSKTPNEHPPYIWQLRVPGIDRIAFDESVGLLIQQLRRRSEGDTRVFDVPRSIRETSQKARVTFLYRNPTQPDEYLLLLDIRSRNDHRAQLFDLLYREFVRQEVLIERFFYDGDLRLCWNEQFQNGLSLRELQHKFGEHQLMIVGSCEGLISPLTGHLERWADILGYWQQRSLLSTQPIVQWGRREAELDTLFRIAPASLNGLLWLSSTDAAPDDRDIDYWKQQPDSVIQPLRISEKLPASIVFDTLEAEFLEFNNKKRDERLLQWLAACAVSPVLHWDATLFFGQLVDNNPQIPLVTVQNLQRLNRLTWFNEGQMPEKARQALLDWLANKHPTLLLRIRRAWKQLLEDNLAALKARSYVQNQAPFEQSVAYEDLRLHLVVNELALGKLQPQGLSAMQRQPLEKELAELVQTQAPDFVALALLDEAKMREEALKASTPEAAPPPDPLRRLLSGWRWQLPLLLLGALAIWLYNPNRAAVCVNDPSMSTAKYDGMAFGSAGSYQNNDYNRLTEIPFYPGDLAGSFTYKDTTYCLANRQQQLLCYEYLVCNFLDSLAGAVEWSRKEKSEGIYKKDVLAASTIPSETFRFIRENRLDSASFYRNIGVAYWNVGLRHLEQNPDAACVYLNALDRWPWRDSILEPSEVSWIGKQCFSDFQGSVGSPSVQSAQEIQVENVQTRISPPQKKKLPNLRMSGKPSSIIKVPARDNTQQAPSVKDRSLPDPQQTPLPDAYIRPFSLFFDKDEPDLRSIGKTTNQTYQNTYRAYLAQKNNIVALNYKETQAQVSSPQNDLNSFFEEDLKGGWNNLLSLLEYLNGLMSKGERVSIRLRGYASKDEGASGYSQNLSARRVACVQNQFLTFDGGLLRKFVESGQLVLQQETLGTSTLPSSAPTPGRDMYSFEAMRARRVEVEVRMVQKGQSKQ